MVGCPGSVVLLLLQPGLGQQYVFSLFPVSSLVPATWHPAATRWTNSNALPPGVGSFQQYYEVGPLKDYSSSTIAWIPSLQLFFLFALGPVVGIIFDNYGPRLLIIGGTLFHVFGLMMASLAKTYYQFILSQGVCSAIGVACLYTPGKFNLLRPSLSVLC
jgi:MFS transporter, MCT family, aspergillic acid transporter